MSTLPLGDGARLLDIHPKTLCRWLKQANLPLTTHPADARIRCVTEEHLHQVARLHDRALPTSGRCDAAAPAFVPSQGPDRHLPEHAQSSASPACSLSMSSRAEANLIQKLAGLEANVMTLQEQLAGLALALLQERERSVEHRIGALESLIHQLMGRPLVDPTPPVAEQESVNAPARTRPLLPAEQQARSRTPPLIEYSEPGTYVIVSSQEGNLPLTPDSPAWFDWLATISSFRFVGQSGHFTAYRESRRSSGPTRSWSAHRTIHQHRFKHGLGVTDRLTIPRLEQAAALLQAEIDRL